MGFKRNSRENNKERKTPAKSVMWRKYIELWSVYTSASLDRVAQGGGSKLEQSQGYGVGLMSMYALKDYNFN